MPDDDLVRSVYLASGELHNGVVAATIQVRAVPSRWGWRYWPLSIANSLAFLPTVITDGEADDHKGMAVNAHGDERKLQGFGTFRQAERARRRFQRELEVIGDDAFCARYGIPASFRE